MLVVCLGQSNRPHSREDCKELLELAAIFFGGSPLIVVKIIFRCFGAIPRTRQIC